MQPVRSGRCARTDHGVGGDCHPSTTGALLVRSRPPRTSPAIDFTADCAAIDGTTIAVDQRGVWPKSTACATSAPTRSIGFAPDVTVTAAPPPNTAGWNNTPVTVTSLAGEAGCRDRVQHRRRRQLDAYGSPLLVTQEGTTDLRFRATDSDGNTTDPPAKTPGRSRCDRSRGDSLHQRRNRGWRHPALVRLVTTTQGPGSASPASGRSNTRPTPVDLDDPDRADWMVFDDDLLITSTTTVSFRGTDLAGNTSAPGRGHAHHRAAFVRDLDGHQRPGRWKSARWWYRSRTSRVPSRKPPATATSTGSTPLASIPIASIPLASIPLASPSRWPRSPSPRSPWPASRSHPSRWRQHPAGLDPTLLASPWPASPTFSTARPPVPTTPDSRCCSSARRCRALHCRRSISPDLVSVPLASLPTSSVPLASIPLASLPLASIPLASIGQRRRLQPDRLFGIGHAARRLRRAER